MDISRDSYDRKPFFIRQAALQLWGVPLARREDLCRTRQLYSFSGFYAELCCDKETGKPTCICSFTRLQRLEPYLEQIDLETIGQLKG